MLYPTTPDVTLAFRRAGIGVEERAVVGGPKQDRHDTRVLM
jgi:hypothetical protein